MSTDENPRLFTKDYKLHVIEYGVGDYQEMSWNDLKHLVMEFNPVIVFQSLRK